MDGTEVDRASDVTPSPVPLLPERFNMLLQSKHFTASIADIDVVKSLYRKIFATLCDKDTIMYTYHWGPSELEQFLPVLRKMHKLNGMSLLKFNAGRLGARLTEEIEANFKGKPGHYVDFEFYRDTGSDTGGWTKFKEGRWAPWNPS